MTIRWFAFFVNLMSCKSLVMPVGDKTVWSTRSGSLVEGLQDILELRENLIEGPSRMDYLPFRLQKRVPEFWDCLYIVQTLNLVVCVLFIVQILNPGCLCVCTLFKC